MHSHTFFARAAIVATLFLFAVIGMSFLVTYTIGKTFPVQNTDTLSRISVAGVPVYVDIVETATERATGLSGRTSLPANQGMLFLFERDGFYNIWMKDMQFAIDILWMSEDGSIIAIEKNVGPETYPKTYTSKQPARWILELPAGFVDDYNITIGKRVTVY